MRFTIPRFVKTDFPRKAVALFFALMVWLAVANQLHDVEIYNDVPVIIRYDSSQMMVENDFFTVDVTLRGAQKRLQRIQSSGISITKTISNAPEGIYFYEIHLSPDDVQVPPGTYVSSIHPDRFRVPVDRVITKGQVPVRLRLTGNLREGYEIVRRSVYPSGAEVRGPSKIVRDIQEIVTEPIILDERLIHDFEVDAKLVSIPKVHVNPETVHVSFELTRRSSQKPFPGLTIQVLNLPRSRLRPAQPLPKVSATVHGQQQLLDKLDAATLKPFIDLTKVTSPGKYRFPVQIWIEAGAELRADYLQPSSVEVVLEEASSDVTEPPQPTPPPAPVPAPPPQPED